MAIYSFTFSPTGTSAKVLHGINAGISETLNIPVGHSDLTFNPIERQSFDYGDIVILAAPVYGGKIAPIVKQRLDGISGNGAKCVVVAVYGNRAFENAVNDFAAFMTDHGFSVCTAAAFIGEHSYSTPMTPIAESRPDQQDIADAYTYGREIALKIQNGELKEIDTSLLTDEPSPAEALNNFRNFVISYQRQQSESPQIYLPEINLSLCDDCGACYQACPTGAITPDSHDADPAKCIKCCACVKSCPQSARALHSPFATPLSENFKLRKSPKWIL